MASQDDTGIPPELDLSDPEPDLTPSDLRISHVPRASLMRLFPDSCYQTEPMQPGRDRHFQATTHRIHAMIRTGDIPSDST